MPTWQVTILTYPKHFMLTVLTARALNKFHGTTSFNIVIDDLACDELNWHEYLNIFPKYIKENLPEFTFSFYYSSNIPQINMFADMGWIRQQMIKFNMDYLVSGKLLLVDGDFVLQKMFVENTVPLQKMKELELFDRQFINYMKYITKDDTATFIKIGDNLYSTNTVPIRYVTSDLLRDLRIWIESLHNKPFNQLHLDIEIGNATRSKEDLIAMTEWELIEYYRKLRNDPATYVLNGVSILPDQFALGATIYGKDTILGRNWFAEQGLVVSDELWNTLDNL